MAKCPKCGKNLTIFNISQFCPHCGVNMRFCNYQENFIREAKYAELSNAVVHVKIRHLKAAFIGSKLAIIRLIAVLFPIVGLLVPAANISIDLPFKETSLALSGLGVYGMVSGGELNLIMNTGSSEFIGGAMSALFRALIAYAGIAVFAVTVLLLTILCFISYKNMQKIICVADILGVLTCVADAFLLKSFISACDGNPVIGGKFSFGFIVEILMFFINFAVNLLLVIKGIPVEYGEGMVERSEIYKKLKKHEITLDELPQPVVETEETRKIDEEIRKEEEHLRKKKAEKEGTAE